MIKFQPVSHISTYMMYQRQHVLQPCLVALYKKVDKVQGYPVDFFPLVSQGTTACRMRLLQAIQILVANSAEI